MVQFTLNPHSSDSRLTIVEELFARRQGLRSGVVCLGARCCRHRLGRSSMKSNLIKLVFILLALWLAYGTPVGAQVAGASLSGTVTDASGGAIGGAQISVKNIATGVVTTTTAHSDGHYEI